MCGVYHTHPYNRLVCTGSIKSGLSHFTTTLLDGVEWSVQDLSQNTYEKLVLRLYDGRFYSLTQFTSNPKAKYHKWGCCPRAGVLATCGSRILFLFPQYITALFITWALSNDLPKRLQPRNMAPGSLSVWQHQMQCVACVPTTLDYLHRTEFEGPVVTALAAVEGFDIRTSRVISPVLNQKDAGGASTLR